MVKLFEVLKKEDIIERYVFKRQLFGGGDYSRGRLTPLGKRIFEASKLNNKKGVSVVYMSTKFHELKIDNVLISIEVVDDGEFDIPIDYDVTIQEIEKKKDKKLTKQSTVSHEIFQNKRKSLIQKIFRL